MQEEGYVAALLYPEGAKDVELGKIVAIIVEDKADLDAFKSYTAESASAPAAAPQPSSAPAAATPAASPAAPAQGAPAKSGDKIFVSPLAKRMAEEKGLALDQITGTGPNNRIIAADVEEAKSQPKAAAAPAKAASAAAKAELPSTSAAYEDFENSQIRKVIAERLTYSKQNIPHYYVTV